VLPPSSQLARTLVKGSPVRAAAPLAARLAA